MKIAVLGLWHLGVVYAACLAELGHEVVVWDPSEAVVDGLRHGKLPVSEPGLSELIAKLLSADRAISPSFLQTAVHQADVVFIAWDTPVNDLDVADPEFVIRESAKCFPFLKDGALVVVSSQLPVGSVRRLEAAYTECAIGKPFCATFACVPENLRLGTAIESFNNERHRIIGTRTPEDAKRVLAVFGEDDERGHEEHLFMSVESAEMVKHARNAHLACQIALTNELAGMCEKTGADARDVERALRADPRIGTKAFVRAGEAIAGGTLLRDIGYLGDLAALHDVPAYMTSAIKRANDHHQSWTKRTLLKALGTLEGRRILILGLSYKEGSDTLRRSAAVELQQWLVARGADVRMEDTSKPLLPQFDQVEATVIQTGRVEYKSLLLGEIDRWADAARDDAAVVIVDPAGYCRDNLGDKDAGAALGIAYYCVGEGE